MKVKATGMARPVDSLGRVVIPKEIRSALDWNTGDPISVYVEGDRVVLRKETAACVFCHSAEVVTALGDKHICANCLAALKG